MNFHWILYTFLLFYMKNDCKFEMYLPSEKSGSSGVYTLPSLPLSVMNFVIFGSVELKLNAKAIVATFDKKPNNFCSSIMGAASCEKFTHILPLYRKNTTPVS